MTIDKATMNAVTSDVIAQLGANLDDKTPHGRWLPILLNMLGPVIPIILQEIVDLLTGVSATPDTGVVAPSTDPQGEPNYTVLAADVMAKLKQNSAVAQVVPKQWLPVLLQLLGPVMPQLLEKIIAILMGAGEHLAWSDMVAKAFTKQSASSDGQPA